MEAERQREKWRRERERRWWCACVREREVWDDGERERAGGGGDRERAGGEREREQRGGANDRGGSSSGS